jgi:hypothetical protein
MTVLSPSYKLHSLHTEHVTWAVRPITTDRFIPGDRRATIQETLRLREVSEVKAGF